MKIFYINIDSRNDKKIFIESQLKKLKIKAERISALTPAKINTDQIKKKFSSNLTNAEIACTSSHIAIWKKIIKTKLPYAIILEDDAILSYSLNKFISAIDQKIPELQKKQIHILRIETRLEKIYQSRSVLKLNDDFSIKKAYSNQYGTGGYIVSQDFCRRFIKSKEIFSAPIDRFLFYNENIVRKLIGTYQLSPALVIDHKNFYKKFPGNNLYQNLSSDIEESRLKNNKKKLKQNKEPILRQEAKIILIQIQKLPLRIFNAVIGKRSFIKHLVDYK